MSGFRAAHLALAGVCLALIVFGTMSAARIVGWSNVTGAAASEPLAFDDYALQYYYGQLGSRFLGALLVGAFMGILAAITLDFIYGRVSRYRLSAASSRFEIYAIVTRDREFLASLYNLAGPESQPPVKRLEQF